MTFNKHRVIQWISCVALAVVAPIAMANLVLNPGFEGGDSPWDPTGNASVSSDASRTVAVPVQLGLMFLVGNDGVLQGAGKQSVDLVVGSTNLFSFFVKGNSGDLSISFGGVAFDDLEDSRIGNPDPEGWSEWTAGILGAGAGDLIFSFLSSSGRPGDFAYVDDVSIVCQLDCSPATNPMPEPGSLLLVGVALSGLALARRRKQI